MRLAVLGDIHGFFGKAAKLLTSYQEAKRLKIDYALQVGDLMPNRNAIDMEFSAAFEKKYRYPGDFGQYDSGELLFPCPLLFIGGNHDPYNWLDDYPGGGWLNDWLYYFGRATSTEHEGLNICAISGIWHPKKSLATERALMPATHTAADRKAFTYSVQGEVEALIEEEKTDIPCDILLLHDWPAGLDKRPFVGSPLNREAILAIKPKRTFCGHMHKHFAGRLGGHSVVCLNAVMAPGDDMHPDGGASMFVFDTEDGGSGEVWAG